LTLTSGYNGNGKDVALRWECGRAKIVAYSNIKSFWT